jgi:hypothetical protein
MSESLRHRVVKGLIRLRRVALLLCAVLLLCFSPVGVRAHGIHSPAQIDSGGAVSHKPTAGLLTAVANAQENAGSSDHDCPSGAGHVYHSGCAGISCHALASGVGAVAYFRPRRTPYQRLATQFSDGRIIAPLFHPPKI